MELKGFAGVLNAWRKFGILGFAENLGLKILFRFCRVRIERKLILMRDLKNTDMFDSGFEGFSFRRICPEELEREDYVRLFQESDYYSAIGAFAPDGELAAQGWICFKTLGWKDSDDFGGGRDLEPGDVYFFKDWTAPKYRGRGLHKQILLARLREADVLGYKRAVIRVDGFNRASRRGIERAGFCCSESFFIVKAFGKIWNGMRYGKEA